MQVWYSDCAALRPKEEGESRTIHVDVPRGGMYISEPFLSLLYGCLTHCLHLTSNDKS